MLDEINKLNLSFPIIINDTSIKQNASENRNRGIEYCLNYTMPDYIMFCDCDDIIHTKKIEYFLYYLSINNNINLFLHNYTYNVSLDIYSSYELNKHKLLLCSNNINNTNLCSFPSTDICHGHPIVRTTLCKKIKYNEALTNGEDGDFCQRINNTYGSVYTFTERLMIYIP